MSSGRAGKRNGKRISTPCASGDPAWRRIQVVADARGEPTEIIFETAEGVEMDVAALDDVLGPVVDEELAPDGRGRRIAFAPDPPGSCRVSLAIARSADGRWLVRALSVAAPESA